MQNWKFAAFGFAIGAMMVFLPLSGKLQEAKDIETRNTILMEVICAQSPDKLTEKLDAIAAPPDLHQIEKGQNKALWDKTKTEIKAQCMDGKEG